ncbi:hypothetical protein DFP73DRAFT_546679 [Morchella snyderi]|nr:hypothetical protein DFP73DRAFT_546679 [Morchella snyderi]
MARDSEPACVGRVARSAASNNCDEPAIPNKQFGCPYAMYYSGSASAISKSCEREFKDFKAVKRHIERIHIKHMRCEHCGLRLARDMNRHQNMGHCKGENREAKVPQKATSLHEALQSCKNMQDLKRAIIEGNQIVYDYQKEPQSINIGEDEDVEYPANTVEVEHPTDDTAEVEHPTGDTVEEESADTAHIGYNENAIGLPLPTADWHHGMWN